jgi:hypothetical protein
MKSNLKHECDRSFFEFLEFLESSSAPSLPLPLDNRFDMAIFDKLKAKLDSNKGGTDNTFANAACALPLGPESVIRYRQQRGVNLGV